MYKTPVEILRLILQYKLADTIHLLYCHFQEEIKKIYIFKISHLLNQELKKKDLHTVTEESVVCVRSSWILCSDGIFFNTYHLIMHNYIFI